jgi:general stress protein YciG
MADEKRGGSGNFANDPERASEAGRKGGEHSHSGGQHIVKRTLARRAHLPSPSIDQTSNHGRATHNWARNSNSRTMRDDYSLVSRRCSVGRISAML